MNALILCSCGIGDVLMYKVTQDINLLVFKEEYNTIKEMSASPAPTMELKDSSVY